jgi:hypothetical protein
MLGARGTAGFCALGGKDLRLAFDSNGNPNDFIVQELTNSILRFCQCSAESIELTPLLDFFVRELPCALVANPALLLENPSNSPLHEALVRVWDFQTEAVEAVGCRFSIVLSCLATGLIRLGLSSPCQLLIKSIHAMLDWVSNPHRSSEIMEIEMDLIDFR